MKKRSPYFSTQFITATISTTLVLVLLGVIVLFVLTAHNLSNYVKENINVSVLISDELDSLQIKQLETDFAKAPYTKSIDYISKDKALKEESEAMGTDPTEFLGYNPFTASFEIKINADYVNADSLNSIVKQIKGNSDIVDVIYSKDLIKSVNDNIRKVSIILFVIAILFTYISFALINNTIRLSIFSKRFIINTMKLVGASWSFIRRPFLAQSLILGVISALLANATLAGCLYFLHEFEPQIDKVINLEVVAIVGITVLAFGILITFFCSLFSLNKYLNMSRKELYYQ